MTAEDYQDYQPQIGDTFKNHEEFVCNVKSYAHKLGFIIRLGKVEYLNASKKQSESPKEFSEEQETEKIVRKRILLCSRAGHSQCDSSKRNRKSQRCNCPFFIRASLDNTNGL